MKKRISLIVSLMMIISLATMHSVHAEILYETNWESPREHMIMVGVTGDRYAGYKERIIHKLNMLRYTACREHECDPKTNLYPNKNYRYHLKDDYGPNPTDEQLSEENKDYRPMTWSDVCEHAAEIRASELALRYGHTRPSGDDFSMNFDGVDKNNTCAECLYNTTRIYNDPWALFEKAIDKFAAEREAYDAYINGNESKTTADFGHYAICINPANVHVGMSALAIAQGDIKQNYQGIYKSFVSLEAGYAVQKTSTQERNNSGRMTQKVEVRENYVDAIKGPDDMIIDDDVAHPASIYVGMKRIDDPDHDPTLSYWKVYDGLSSTSSNEKVATMDKKGIVHPRGAGTTTITVKVNGYTCSFPVTVTQTHQHQHHYQEQVIKAATCEKNGEKKLICSDCGDEKTETIPALGHKYGVWTSLDDQQHQRICENDQTHVEKEDHNFNGGVITKAATYQEEGTKTYTCRDCGFTKTETIPILTHVHNYQLTNTKAATCDEKGMKTYTCTICGDRYTEDIPVLGHDYGNWQKFNDLVHERVCKNDHNHVDKQPHRYDEGKIIVASTCTQTGVKIYTCQDCGYTKRESIPTIEHDYDDGQIVVAPTCVAKGVKVYTCKTCGQTKSEELDYDSHNHPTDQITVVNKKEATATSEGYTGDQKCRTCGQIVKKGTTIPKTNHTHTWNQGTITKAASCIEAGAKTYTCTICGETKTETIPALGHDYGEWEKYDDLIHKRVCKRDIHHVEKQSHRYDEGQVVIKPTCTRVGEKIYICQDCGYMKRENLSKLDHHDYDDGKIVVVPTCTTKGVKVYTCKNCGETKSEELDYDPQNHSGSQVIKNKKEATATEDGYSGDLVCNGCGQIVKKGTVISKTGHAHSWNEGEMTKEPSCTQAGEKVYTCSVCLETKAESIPALGHDYDDGKITITPTCTKKGEKVYTCKRCGDEKTEALPMDQSNHSLEHLSVQNKKEATITEEGYSGDVICSDCGTIVKVGTVIPKLASSNENNPGTADQNKEAANTDDAKKTSDEKTNQTAGSESDQTNTNVGNKQDETITPVNKETPQQSHSSSYDGNGTNEKQTKQTPDLHKNEQVVTNAISNNAQKNDNNNGNTEDHFYKGKSAQTLEQAVTAQTKMIVGLKNDHDIKGSSYRKLTLKVKKRAKKSLQLSWKKLPGRMTYLVYGNRCGHRYHFLKKTSKTTYKQGKLKKGTYYKYLVIALGSKGQSVAISKVVHIATKGGLYGNVKAIKMKKTLKLKKKQSYKLPYKLVYDAKKKKIHRPIALESSNTKVVSVQKGKVQGKKKGIAYIYVYAQNGAYAKIKVTVK